MPANILVAGTKNFCPGTRMARSYKMALPMGEPYEKHKGQSLRGFSFLRYPGHLWRIFIQVMVA